MSLNEYHYWSPTLGCDAVRLSMTDDWGGEYFAILPADEGRGWRARRQEAVDKLLKAMTPEDEGGYGLEPGQIAWR